MSALDTAHFTHDALRDVLHDADDGEMLGWCPGGAVTYSTGFGGTVARLLFADPDEAAVWGDDTSEPDRSAR